MIAFAVSDTGIGIAADQQERAFRPFEQIEATAARRYQGTGLGLAIARESVGLLGGKIELVSELGKGSTFTCLFPVRLAEGSTLSVEPSQTLEATTTSTSNHPGPLHILVIEDDPILAEQLTAIIEGRGLSVVVAETGELGLSVARQRRPLGIVLDVKLPDVDGWTVMERLKSDPSTNGIPVHFLSALDAPENGLTRGAVGYLTKPATRTELRELIRSLVPEHPTQSQKILVVEDSTIEGQSIVALLKSGDFEAYHVTSAEEALARMDVEAFGCIILDLGLKAMDGLGFLEVLRQRTDFGSISVIVHTGRMLSRKETNRLQEYAQAIVVKDGQSSTRLLEEVRLFVHHLKAQFSRSELPPTQQSTTADVDLTGVHVLLVEDDMRTVYSLSALLQGRGCQVLIAENGRDALAVLEENQQVECVLTDIMMPEMDGYEMMRRLRADGRLKHLPIVALTAKAMAGEQERCLAAGASAYLSKPVDAKKLLGAVFEWTRGGRRVA
jgi:CheY-like chemotaxis protein